MPTPPAVVVTFLGGLGEIGRNMAAIEIDGRIAVIDVGVTFPSDDHPGVDLILPDWATLRERADDVTAVFLTHGHMDHIGALPYFLDDFPDVTVYGTRLTLAFVRALLEEHPQHAGARLEEFRVGDTVHDGPFQVEVVQANHSIPDSCALAFHTPHGLVLHSGDFKLDQTPIDGRVTDLAHLSRLGDQGVTLLLADSTNADQPGHIPTERAVGPAIREAMAGAAGLVVVASFASHVHRIQQVLDAAEAVGRRPVFVGRSMARNMAIAAELGELIFDQSGTVALEDIDEYDRSELVVICTGSQGEPYSALSLMASGDHRQIEVGAGDVVILASSLIPGNEKAVFRSINGLVRRGARVIHSGVAPVHVSGHAAREDLILYHNVVQPRFFTPVHGEFRQLAAHADVAVATGCPHDNVLVCEDGDRLVVVHGRVDRGEPVMAGQVLIDGLLADVGPAVLRDRRRLGEEGICVCVVTVDPHRGSLVGEPTVVQKGVIYEGEADLLEGAQKAVLGELAGPAAGKFHDTQAIQRHVVQALGTYWRAQTGRRPVSIPLVVEV
ncbi:MAG TPA: ribonuclease J [Nitriliruptorales bacterium]|nr:ribonuclease J [Nitriliruptorales bacterium]